MARLVLALWFGLWQTQDELAIQREVEALAVLVRKERADLIPLILLAFVAPHDIRNVAGFCHSYRLMRL
jgi:hypothetical protein